MNNKSEKFDFRCFMMIMFMEMDKQHATFDHVSCAYFSCKQTLLLDFAFHDGNAMEFSSLTVKSATTPCLQKV